MRYHPYLCKYVELRSLELLPLKDHLKRLYKICEDSVEDPDAIDSFTWEVMARAVNSPDLTVDDFAEYCDGIPNTEVVKFLKEVLDYGRVPDNVPLESYL